jgi:hypothetical protein
MRLIPICLVPTLGLLAAMPLAAADLINGLGGTAGFGEQQLAPNDDGSVLVDLRPVFPTGLVFYGQTYTGVYLNNNGNLTFLSASGQFTPTAITGNTTRPIMAAWYSDVFTNGVAATPTSGGTSTGANRLWYDIDATAGRVVFTWDDVGYYGGGNDTKRNAFQIVLTSLGAGDVLLEFRYEALQWTTGSASGGSGGLGGTVARAGYSAGDGTHFFELPQSGRQSDMLGLTSASNCGVPGVYRFRIQRPVATITTPSPWMASATIPFTITFPVPVQGLATTDLALTGATLTNLTGSGANYTAELTPTGDGTVTLQLADGAVTTEFLTSNPAATANVIADRTAPTVTVPAESIGAGTLTLAGTVADATSGIDTALWEVVAGNPALLVIANPSAATTSVSATADGTWTLLLRVRDRAGNVTERRVQVIRDSIAPTINAGNGSLVAGGMILAGQASDALSGLADTVWSQVSGPGSSVFSAASDLSSAVTFPIDGTYVLRLRAVDRAGNATENTVQVISDQTPPTVNAGPDVTFIGTAALVGQASDALSGLASVGWTVISGPTGGQFTVPDVLTTSFNGPSGTCLLGLTARDAAGNVATDTVQLVIDGPPLVDAGPNALRGSAFTPTATASDVEGPVRLAWTQVSGPGTATVSPADSLAPIITCDQDGVYVMRLTVTDSMNQTSSDELTLTWDTVAPAAPVVTQVPPVVRTSFTVSGFAEPGSTVQVTLGNAAGGTEGVTRMATVAADGTWSVALVGSNGTWPLTLFASDPAGNRSSNVTLTAQIDGITPTLAVNEPLNSRIGSGPFTVRLRPSEAVTGLDGTGLVLSNATRISQQQDGSDLVLVIQPQRQGTIGLSLPAGQVADLAGNPAAAFSKNFTAVWDVSGFAPTAMTFSGQVQGANGTTLRLSGDLIPLATDGSWSVDVRLGPVPSTTVVRPTATDGEGQSSTVTRTVILAAPGNG